MIGTDLYNSLFSIGRKLLLLLLCSSAISQKSFSQTLNYNQLDQFFNNRYTISPVATDTSYQYNIKADNKTQTGLFAGVSKIYFDGDIKIKKNGDNGFHFLGAQVSVNKEGSFIKRNRVYGRYGIYQKLTSSTALSAGVSIGAINYMFQSSQGGSGGSDITPDASIGLSLVTKKFQFGISSQQLFQPKIKPIDQTVVLHRFYNFNASYLFSITNDFELEINGLLQLLNSETKSLFFAPLLRIKDLFKLGGNYNHNQSIAFITGIEKFDFNDYKLSIFASYKIPTNDISVPDNAIELFLSIQK